jgi:hypothetical protein
MDFKAGKSSTAASDVLRNMTPIVDRTAKFLKNRVSVVSKDSGYSDLEDVVDRMAALLRRLVEEGAACGLKGVASIHLLQLVMPTLEKNSSRFLDHILLAVRSIYSLLSGNIFCPDDMTGAGTLSVLQPLPYDEDQDERSTAAEIEIDGDDYQDDDDADDSGRRIGRVTSASHTQRAASGVVEESFQATTDAAISLLRLAWKALAVDQVNERLIESGIYAAGILRIYTAEDMSRRRLLHMGFLELLSSGLKTVLAACNSRDEKTAVTMQLSQLSIQLVSIARNFVSDSSAKSQLLSAEFVTTLCSFIHAFKEYPELTLNCSRVIAKLSLQDSFRAQINRRPYYLKCLIEVIILEARCCSTLQQVAWLHAASNGESAAAETVAWPTW